MYIKDKKGKNENKIQEQFQSLERQLKQNRESNSSCLNMDFHPVSSIHSSIIVDYIH